MGAERGDGSSIKKENSREFCRAEIRTSGDCCSGCPKNARKNEKPQK